MAVTTFTGFEARDTSSSNLDTVLNGTAAISQTQARTGTSSLRINPASGAGGNATDPGAGGYVGYVHFGLYVATLPSLTRAIGGALGANEGNLALNSDGTLSVRNDTTVIGTSSVALATGVWYWIGWRNLASSTGTLLQIDGVDQISGTTASIAGNALGLVGTEASSIDLYFDDLICDGAGFINPSRVNLCVGISDNAVGTGWTNDAAGTTNLFNAVKNAPPNGIADTTGSTGLHQIRNAANNTNAYAVNLTTYATAGIVSSDKVIAAQAYFATGAPTGTGAKSGSMTLSNPTIAKTTIGTFYNGSAAAGTYPSNWKITRSAIQASPTVTIANSPVLTVTQDTGSTRVSMCCAMFMYVAWTPGHYGKTRAILQAVNRATY